MKLVNDPILPAELTESFSLGAEAPAAPAEADKAAPVEPSSVAPAVATQPPATEAPDTAIPDKFRGKSAEDIARSYQELESQFGRVTSEKASKERELEALLAQLRIAKATSPEAAQEASPARPSRAPREVLEAQWGDDPKEAVAQAVDMVSSQLEAERSKLQRQAQLQDFSSYVEKQRRENPEFAELHANGTLDRIGSRYAGLPDQYKFSREMVDTIYAVARAERIQDYVKAEIEKRSKVAGSIVTEKRAAGGTNPIAAGQAQKPYTEMTLAELEATIGFANRK